MKRSKIPFGQLLRYGATAAFISLASVSLAQAAVSVSALFADNMMFQRNKDIKVFGQANSGETVNVSFGGKSASTKAGSDGKWLVSLDPVPAGGPYTLTINSLTFTNILVGDVWFVSGQSNMQIKLASDADASSEIPKANFPQMRILRLNTMFPVPSGQNMATLIDWSEVTPKTADDFSAVGYYFGKNLHQELGVPIGLIDSSRGGTKAEAWSPPNSFSGHPIGKSLLEYFDGLPSGHPEKQLQDQPGSLFPEFVEPLTPFSLKGVVWYQGEHNVGRNMIYQWILTNMIESWRERFQQADLPFVLVQLPDYGYTGSDLQDSEIAGIRDAQGAVAASLNNVEYSCNIEQGDGDGDIHPSRKKEVGRRVALTALKHYYNKNIVWTGPRIKSVSFDSSGGTVSFENLDSALKAVSSPKGFLLATSEDSGFQRANASVSGNTVRVTGVSNPVALRYAWEDAPDVTLTNQASLPVPPFRTDSWSVNVERPAFFNTDIGWTNDLKEDKDDDGRPNFVEYFAATNFRKADSGEKLTWNVSSPFANHTALRFRMRSHLSNEVSYKIQGSSDNGKTWSDLSTTVYPVTSDNTIFNLGYMDKGDDHFLYEVHAKGSKKLRLVILTNGATYYSEGSGPVVVENTPPVANAGPDQTVEDTDDNGSQSVSLNGSGSSDADGSIATYAWSWNGGSATGASPSVSLPVGATTITLTVTDNKGASDTDAVKVTITAPSGTGSIPVANAGSDITVTDSNGSGNESITLDGSGSLDADGPIASYAWSWSGGSATGATASAVFPVGTTTVTLTVTDNDGNTASDIVRVIVNAKPSGDYLPGTLNVELVSPSEGQQFAVGEPITIQIKYSSDITQMNVYQSGWTFIGNASEEPFVFVWDNAAAGDYTLSIRSKAGATNAPVQTVTISVVDEVPPVDEPPSAAFTATSPKDDDGDGFENVTLDASGSTDDKGISAYAWSWNGGSASGQTATVSLPVGSTNVTLTATDTAGQADSFSGTVTVRPGDVIVQPGDPIVIDSSDAAKMTFAGNWWPTNLSDAVGGTFMTSNAIAGNTATYTPGLTGNYTVEVYLPSGFSRTSLATYLLNHAGGQDEFEVNQTNGGNWVQLGSGAVTLNAASTIVLHADVVQDGDTREERPIADAIRLTPSDSGPTNPPVNNGLYFEAEDFDNASTTAAPWIEEASLAPEVGGGKYMVIPDNSFANNYSGIPAATGYLDYAFTMAETGPVYVAIKAFVPQMTRNTSDSVYVDILEDGLPATAISTGFVSGGWFWNEWITGKPATLLAGNYTLRIHHREDGLMLDQIAISADLLDI